MLDCVTYDLVMSCKAQTFDGITCFFLSGTTFISKLSSELFAQLSSKLSSELSTWSTSSRTTLFQLKNVPVLEILCYCYLAIFSSLAGKSFYFFHYSNCFFWNFHQLMVLVVEITNLSYHMWLCSGEKFAFISKFNDILISVILDLNRKIFLAHFWRKESR